MSHVGDHRAALLRALVAAVLLTAGGCGAPEGSAFQDDGFDISYQREAGGACQAGQVAPCYSSEPLIDDSGEEYCLEGTMECHDGRWSECNFDGAARRPIIGDPELCGGCDPACFRQHTCPTGRDLNDDNAENVRFDLDRNGIVLGGRSISARYAYIANSSEATVSKIDLGTRREVGRYYVGSSPSRTAVDSRGNCYVAMRGEHWETVAKIAGDQSYCVDRNRNGRIDTSSGSNVLGRGNDECVIWTSTAAVGACPRAVAIDRRGRVWIGGWCIRQFYVLNPEDGSLIRTVPISASAYGAAIDSEGMLWYSGRSHGWIQNINTETYAVGPVRGPSCGGDLYGIAIDLEDRVWIVCAHQGCRAARYDPSRDHWMNICSIPYPRTARGITIDSGGDIWIATHHYWDWNYGQGYGYRFNPETGAQEGVYTVHGCDGAIGIASDFEDNIWFACHGSWSADALDPDTGRVDHIRVGSYPYTYSDFTGFLRATVTAPEGSYTQLYDSHLVCDDGADVVWSQLYFETETPDRTRINFYARTADRTADLGAAREILVASVPGDESPMDIQGTLTASGVANGMRYLEIRVQLQSLDGETSPVFRNMDLIYYCVADECADGELNGRETDVDCGGAECDPCDVGDDCERNADCASGVCHDGVCDVPAWDGIREFSNCGATGPGGPSQANCDAAYGGGRLAGEVTVGSGIQEWVVPTTGTYRIEAYGAQGASAQGGRTGGRGARMRGDFNLEAGTVLRVIVGQQGMVNNCNGSGGGGSFVVRSDGTALIVAGGGAGTRQSVDRNGCDGRTSEEGGDGSGSRSNHDCGPRSGHIREGGIVSGGSWGSGGGGLTGNGATDGSWGDGGSSYTNGARGGDARSCGNAHGGFGGGGTGNGCCGGGGGGGYSGGDGGRVAGGGGSYNGGANRSNTEGARSGHGRVTIDMVF